MSMNFLLGFILIFHYSKALELQKSFINVSINIEYMNSTVKRCVEDDKLMCVKELSLFGSAISNFEKESLTINIPWQKPQIVLAIEKNGTALLTIKEDISLLKNLSINKNDFKIKVNISCSSNFIGSQCNIIDLCKRNLCGKNSLNCTNTKDFVDCKCYNGYSGKLCEVKPISNCTIKTLPYTQGQVCLNIGNADQCGCFVNSTTIPDDYFNTTPIPTTTTTTATTTTQTTTILTTLAWTDSVKWPFTDIVTYGIVFAQAIIILILLIILLVILCCRCCCGNKKDKRNRTMYDDTLLESNIFPRNKTNKETINMDSRNNNQFRVTSEDIEARRSLTPLYDLSEDRDVITNPIPAPRVITNRNHDDNFIDEMPNEPMSPIDDFSQSQVGSGMSTFGRR